MMKKKRNESYEIMDICFCGHTGAARKTQHGYEGFLPGSGRCLVKGCGCAKFVWKRSVKMRFPVKRVNLNYTSQTP